MKRGSLILIVFVFLIAAVGVFFIHPDYIGSKVRPWRLGLDLVGGSHLVYQVDMANVVESDRSIVMNGLKDVIEKRVNLFGVSEPQVLTAKSGEAYRLIVELAGIKDISAAIKQIGETPNLQFSEVREASAVSGVAVQLEGGATATSTASEAEFVPTALTGRYVKGAQLNFNNITGQPEVALLFNDEGAKIFEEVTARNVGKQLAVFLDNNLITAPVVNERIPGGRAQITGKFTLQEARQMVERFNAGALPAPITLVSQQTVGATLGTDSLTKTLWAGLIGTLLIMLFMMIYYRGLGFFASLALIVYTILLLGIFKLLGITMTLAGIAGIILSIGMAVDANVLIFERTKEERKKGVSKLAAIHEGFHRAWPSIRDSNIATIITSLVLYNLTSSFIKGFALSLLIGVMVSMFTAITITRVLLQIFFKEKIIAKASA